MGSSQATLTREIPSLSFRGAIDPGSVDTEKRTAKVVWTTGAKVRRGFWEPFDEELSLDPKHVRMGRLESGTAPLLNSHASYSLESQIGVVERAEIGTATVRFSKRADVEPIFQDVVDHIICNVSVGYRVHKYEKQPQGDEEAVPTYRAVDWEPYELSFTPIGADPGAHTRAADAFKNPCVFVDRSEESQMPDKTAAVTETTSAANPAEPQAQAAPVTDEVRAAEERATKLERDRAAGIRVAVRAAKLDEKLAAELIDSGVAIDAARAQVLERLATASDSVKTEQHVSVEVVEDGRDRFVRGASAWLFERAGMTAQIEKAQKDGKVRGFEKVSLDGAEYRGLSLYELARESLDRRAVKTRGLSRMDLVAQAFTYRSGGMAGTSDFPVLLENVMHKMLLAAYATVEDTWRRFCATRTVSDFRAHNFFRSGSLGVLDSLNEHGEYKNKVLPDGQKTSITTATKGNIIAITRQLIIDDDLGAFTNLLGMLGRAAALTIESDVYALLALNGGLGPTQSDSQPFFHANRGNVNASASGHTVAGWDADRVIMAAQKDISGNEHLGLRPAVLLVASGQYAAARVLNASLYDHDGTKLQKPNAVVGLYRDIVDTPRLSGTRRYVFAEPAVAPAIIVAFLEGQGEAPVLETEQGWRVDGTEMKVRLDAKAQMFDWKGTVTNAGA